MNLNEQDARKLQELHFHWDDKYKEFYRDWNLPGNNYMTLRQNENEWVLYEFMGEDHDGAIEDWTEFNSLGEVFEYFEK